MLTADEQQQLDQMFSKAEKRERECKRRAIEHRASRRAYQFQVWVLSAIAIVASLLIASDLFVEGEEFAGAAPDLALVAAIAAGLNTGFDLPGKAADHKTARWGFSALARRFEDFPTTADTFDDYRKAFDALRGEYDAVDQQAPEPGNISRWIARRSDEVS